MKILKKLLIALICLLLAGGSLFLFQKYRDKKKSAEVVPVSAMNLGWLEDNYTSSGIIYEKESQSVYLTSEQLVKEVYVQQGNPVKKGDPLLKLDIESQQLAVDLKALEVERAGVRIGELQKELNEIRNMKPYVPTPVPYYPDDIDHTPEPTPTPTPTPTPEPDPDPTPTPSPTPSGKVKEKINDAWTILDDLNTPIDESATGTIDNPLRFLVQEDAFIYGSFFNELKEKGLYAVIEIRNNDEIGGELKAAHTFNGNYLRDYGADEVFYAKTLEVANGSGFTYGGGIETTPNSSGGNDSSNEGNGSNGGRETLPDIYDYEDNSSGYTAQEIAELAKDKQEEIKRADLNYRKLQLELKMMRDSLKDGIVYAKKDGVIKISHAPNDIPNDGSPFIKIVSGEGVMIQGSVSELLLDKVQIGQSINATSWETGESYTATVASIDDYPSSSYYYGEGNPNSSYYNFYAYIDNGEELPENTYLELSFDIQDSGENMMFIPQAYIRNDAKGKYVMKDEDGALKKHYIKTGKTYWGEYTQILSGLSDEDYIAFPYGDGAIEGISTIRNEEGGLY